MKAKHPPLARRQLGQYAACEFALLGTTCERIERLMADCLDALAPDGRVAGLTGDHQSPPHAWTAQAGSKQFFGPQSAWNSYDDKLWGAHYDLVLANGNHYPAQQQIVFVDPAKAGTLERRQQQLTDIAALVFCPGVVDIPSWLQAELAQYGHPPILSWEEAQTALPLLFRSAMQARQAPLKALILIGGKSSRMGSDKAQLRYRGGIAEADRLASACRSLGLEVFFSVAAASASNYAPLIVDRFLDLGPMGAIASAFLHDPQSAWLVLACDLPLLEASHIDALINARDPSRYATAVRGAAQEFPEPLIAIYEPRAYARLLQFLSLGYSCPRKMLINTDVAQLVFTDESPLTNANTPGDREAVLAHLRGDE